MASSQVKYSQRFYWTDWYSSLMNNTFLRARVTSKPTDLVFFSPAAPRKVPKVTQGAVCNVHWSDKSIRLWAKEECGRLWNDSAVLILEYDDPAERRTMWSSLMLLWPLKALPVHHRCEAELYSNTESFHYLFLHDARTSFEKSWWVWSLHQLLVYMAHTKTMKKLIRDLSFAAATALVAHTQRALQRITSWFTEPAYLFGLEVNFKKTGVLHQPAAWKEYRPLHMTIGVIELEANH